MLSTVTDTQSDFLAERLLLRGRVQGVGFRPFVFRLADQLAIRGWVKNTTGQVEIHAEAAPAALEQFRERLISKAPPLARPEMINYCRAEHEGHSEFRIMASGGDAPADIVVPPDHFMCADCQEELKDPTDRRFSYPFLNCTQCGPRWTLITDLPYDRPNTSLSGFPLCADCLAEYQQPTDRRFHAEPVACPVCGPWLSYRRKDGSQQAERAEALRASVRDIEAGRIVAVKGVGGYHLMCDARNQDAVAILRKRKQRPGKPFAVMFPTTIGDDSGMFHRYLQATPEEYQALISPERPIVLTRARPGTDLAENVAPGLQEIGAFLPYSPLHQLLLDALNRPLIATSGNLSGEPVLTDPVEAEQRLAGMADSFLHHNRPIVRPADDSVVRSLAGKIRPIRVGRGLAPVDLSLPFSVPPMLALGAHMKNTVAIGFDQRAILSPHIGEMDSPRSLEVFEKTTRTLTGLYQIEPGLLICDAHPTYATSRWARRQSLPQIEVFHHHAHASAIWGEHCHSEGEEDLLVFTWDGVGYGEDGSLWGGETFYGAPGAWQRVASLRPFQLPGGERVGRQPWRSAVGLCWTAGQPWTPDLPDQQLEWIRHAFERSVNCPTSTAVGRVFDAAASLLLGVNHSSYEAEGPMQLEALASGADYICGPELPLVEDKGTELLRLDWEPLLTWLSDDTLSRPDRAMGFHSSLASALGELAMRLGNRHGVSRVGLGGGVFQNRLLSKLAVEALRGHGLKALLCQQIPCNDAAISFGQIVEAGARLRKQNGTLNPIKENNNG